MSLHEEHRPRARDSTLHQHALDHLREAAQQPTTGDDREIGAPPVPSRRRAAIAMVTTLIVGLVLAAAAFVLVPADVRADVKEGIRDGWRETGVTKPN